jgi:hypothetical protein
VSAPENSTASRHSVLHDLNQAARYGTHLIAMKDGGGVAQGPAADIVTADLVAEVFGLACHIVPDPVTGTAMVVPIGRGRRLSGVSVVDGVSGTAQRDGDHAAEEHQSRAERGADLG